MKDLGIEKRDQNFKIELHLDEVVFFFCKNYAVF